MKNFKIFDNFKIYNARLLKMAERGEPKNLAGDDEDKRVDDKTAADIEAVKGPIKSWLNILMTLLGPAEYCDEAALMYQIVAEQLSKIEITTLNDMEVLQLLVEEEN